MGEIERKEEQNERKGGDEMKEYQLAKSKKYKKHEVKEYQLRHIYSAGVHNFEYIIDLSTQESYQILRYKLLQNFKILKFCT